MTVNTDVTIKELADKLGISKQAVRRYFDQLPPSLIPTKKGGAYQINIEAQEFIANKVERVDTNVDTHVDTSQSEEFKSLQKEFIDDKNEQIESLKKQIERLHTLLDQQQQLTLQSNKQIEKLQLQLENTEHETSNSREIEKESEENQQVQVGQLKKELEQRNLENEELKETVGKLSEPSKKGFWQRLFNQ